MKAHTRILILFIKSNTTDLARLTGFFNPEQVLYQVIVSGTQEAHTFWEKFHPKPSFYLGNSRVVVMEDDVPLWHTTNFDHPNLAQALLVLEEGLTEKTPQVVSSSAIVVPQVPERGDPRDSASTRGEFRGE